VQYCASKGLRHSTLSLGVAFAEEPGMPVWPFKWTL